MVRDGSSSLSICCLVRDPPERVAAILEALRPVADEIVVAADTSGPSAESGLVAELADRFYRVEFEPPFEQYLPWLHDCCRGEWIFRIDGDEMPGAELLASLPSLLGRRDILQYRLPRRWLFGDPSRWLAHHPWAPDYQVRIVRNDPATLRFAGTLHSSAEPRLPARYLVEPIYHLTLLVASAEEREQRVRSYQEAPDAPPDVDNAKFYLPGNLDTLRLEPTPPGDRALVERALAGVPAPAIAVGDLEAVDVPLGEVLRLAPRRHLEADAYNVEIECLEADPSFVAGRGRELPVRVRNSGREWFPWGAWSPPVRAAYHWLTPAGAEVVWDGHRTLLTHDLGPGDDTVLSLTVIPPAEPGPYVLEIDLVHEGVRWFGCAARVPVTVEPPPAPAVPSSPATAADGPDLVVITGMHRSGTSLVARLVNLLGVDLGDADDLVPPGPDNPAGFWEHREIVALNDEVLAVMGGSALSPPALPDGWGASPTLDPQRERARLVVAGLLAGERPAGWKDPRTSLTLPFWRTVARVGTTVLVLRHPLEVARSLEARNGIAEGTAARLYVTYVVAALQNDPTCTIVRYEELFAAPEEVVKRIARALEMDEAEGSALQQLRSSIEPALRSSRLESADGEGDAGVAVAVYRLLAAERRDVVLGLGAALRAWSFATEGDARSAQLSQELLESRAREAEVAEELKTLGGRRIVRIGLALAGMVARMRRSSERR